MQRKKIYCSGLLLVALVWPMAGRADETPGAASAKAGNDELRQLIKTLEDRVHSLQAELDESRAATVQAQMHADAFENRCRKLQDELARVKATGTLMSLPGSSQPKVGLAVRTKPTSGIAQGKITAISKEGRLLQISIGTEAGIKEGQSLEVFRLGSGAPSQRPIYLGAVKLIRVDAQAALGEFKSVPGIEYRPKIGDEAASELIVK